MHLVGSTVEICSYLICLEYFNYFIYWQNYLGLFDKNRLFSQKYSPDLFFLTTSVEHWYYRAYTVTLFPPSQHVILAHMHNIKLYCLHKEHHTRNVTTRYVFQL